MNFPASFSSVKQRLACFVAAIAFGTIVFPVHADITPGSDWEGTSFDIWTNYWGYTQVAAPASGRNPGGWLQVTFTNTSAGPGTSWNDIVYTKTANLFAGTYSTQQWPQTSVRSDFQQSDVVAGGLAVVRKSITNDNMWSYSLTPSTGTNWTTFTAGLANWQDWAYPLASVDQYLANLQSVDWIGVYKYRDTTSQQIYRIDNINLMVPEPTEYILLAAAVIISGISLCRKRHLKGDAVICRD
jgi:hypothetical protein